MEPDMTKNATVEHGEPNLDLEQTPEIQSCADEVTGLYRLEPSVASPSCYSSHALSGKSTPLLLACLLLPLLAHLALTLAFHNLKEVGIILFVTPMIAFIAYRVKARAYLCENILPIIGGSLTLTALLIAPFFKTALSPVERDFIVCSVPIAWAMLFSLFFLNCHKADLTACRAPLLFASIIVGVAICLLIWCIGGSRYVLVHPNPIGVNDRFPYTFGIWESNPISTHYFLTFDRLLGPFERKQSYRCYTPLYTLLNYIPLRIVKSYSGLEYFNLMRLTPFFTGFLGALIIPTSILWAFTCSLRNRGQFLFLTLATTALILLIPDLWTVPLTHNLDNTFPITALLGVLVAVSIAKASSTTNFGTRAFTCGLLAFITLALPYFSVVVGISLLFVWTGQSRRFFLLTGIVTSMASAVSMGSVYFLAKLAGISPRGTAALERMGFAQLFDPLTAVLHPSNQDLWRPYSFIFVGGTAALLAIALQVGVMRTRRASTLTYLLLGPALWVVLLFPQSVSIHPDVYDTSLAVGGTAALMFVLFGILEENIYPAHRYVPWIATAMCGLMIHNIKLIQMCFTKFF